MPTFSKCARSNITKTHLFAFLVTISVSVEADQAYLSDDLRIYITTQFTSKQIHDAEKNEKMIKLLFDGEKREGMHDYDLNQGDFTIKVLLGEYGEKAQFILFAESIDGDVPPVIIDSTIHNMKYTTVRLPIGSPCSNKQYRVTVFLKIDNQLLWNNRSAKSYIADCGQID